MRLKAIGSPAALLAMFAVLALSACAEQAPPPVTAVANTDNEAVVRRYVELINAHEFEQLKEVFAPDFKLYLGNETLDGTQVADLTRMVLTSFPDFRHEIEDLFSNGDRVVLRLTDHGTHQGEFQGIAASGRTIEIGQISIYRVVDGRIAEAWEQADLAGLLQQIQVKE